MLNNYLYMLDLDTTKFCLRLAGVFQLIGYIYFIIKIVAPIILLVIGMYQSVKAISLKDEESIKKSWKSLGKKAIAAVSIFLVATMVGMIMNIVGGEEYTNCVDCINKPFSCVKEG